MRGPPNDGQRIYAIVEAESENPVQVFAEVDGDTLEVLQAPTGGGRQLDDTYPITNALVWKPESTGVF